MMKAIQSALRLNKLLAYASATFDLLIFLFQFWKNMAKIEYEIIHRFHYSRKPNSIDSPAAFIWCKHFLHLLHTNFPDDSCPRTIRSHNKAISPFTSVRVFKFRDCTKT